MEALHDVVRAGKARYIGASSMYAWQFAKAQHVADLGGWTRFASMQDHYNLIYREEEREMHPLCLDQGVGVIPWSPLARGRLARGPQAGGTTRADTDTIADAMYTDADDAVVQAVADVAKARGLRPAQVALAWVLQRGGGDGADRRGDEAGPRRGRDRGARRGARRGRGRCAGGAVRAAPGAGPRVSPGRRGPRRRGARLRGRGQDDGGHRAHGRAAPPRHGRGAVQGGPGLHRPRLPHARRGPARAQPRPGARRRRPDRAAGPARRGRGGGRGRRGGDGALRRAAGRRQRVDRARSPGCSGRRSCWSSTPAASRAASPRCCTASVRSTPRSTWRGWCSTGSGRPGTRRCCARPRPRSGCRCSARCPAARRSPCRRGTWGWSPRPSTARRRRRRWTPWPSWWPRTSTSTR